jgi:enterochelin esterase family protein
MAGTLQSFRYGSAALGQDQVAQVYLPAGDPPKGGWPVLYLLHGLNGAATDWDRMGGIRLTMDRLIGEHEIKPLMVVMPSGGNSWYVDSADVKGPGNYATAISHDLTAAVEAAFPVGKDRAHRAIAGLSMGGFGALRLGLSEPSRYSAIAALSPAIWQNIPSDAIEKAQKDFDLIRPAYFQKPDPNTVTVGVVLPPNGQHFGGAFGTPFDARRFNAANVFTLLERAVEAGKNLPSIYLTVGDDDSHLLWRGAIAFFETMRMDGRMIDFRVTDGDHNWDCWKGSLVDALKFIDHSMAQPPA